MIIFRRFHTRRDVCRFPGPFVREGLSPSASPLLHRATPNVRAVPRSGDTVDHCPNRTSTPPTSPQLGKLIIRAARSPDRATSPDYVRTPATVVGPTSPTSHHRQVRGAYVNVQGDEGKTTSTSGTSADEHRDCTGLRTGRLEAAPRTSAIAPGSKDEPRPPGGPTHPGTVALAPSNKLPEPDGSARICHGGSQVEHRPKRKVENHRDENRPPAELNGDVRETSVRAIAPRPSKNDPVSFNPARSRLDFEKSDLCPKILRVTGNTPKLGRKLLVSDLDTPSFRRRGLEAANDDGRNTVVEVNDTVALTSTAPSAAPDDRDSDASESVSAELSSGSLDNGRTTAAAGRSDAARDRGKVKRSESYRMANSPIMFIKKFSSGADKSSSKICRTPSEELQEELLKERINYPETVSSPEPRPVDGNATYNVTIPLPTPVPVQTGPISPRPRASDLEPARVLKYSSNDTEIW